MELLENTLISRYFNLTPEQSNRFSHLNHLFLYWNEQINLVSRKDLVHLEEHHFLHSLAIARVISFLGGTRILDVGTGGGLPGIPLAILFPDTHFTLVDSIAKKIKVVNHIIEELGLKNVEALATRVEDLPKMPKFDFIVSRAVTRLSEFWPWVAHRIESKGKNSLENGLLALKGGDLREEIRELGRPVILFPIRELFSEPYFETKVIILVPNHGKG